MTTATVYAPHWGDVTRVNGAGHNPCNSGVALVDQSAPDINIADFIANSAVKSILCRHATCSCICSGTTLHWAVKVEMYKGTSLTGGLIGWVLYGHLDARQADGYYVSSYTAGTKIGIGSSHGCISGCCPVAGCWSGPHFHMECDSGGSTPLTGYTTGIVEGGTPFFNWTF